MKPCAMARAVSFVFLALGVVVMVAADSVIDELEKNGLPVGLLPSSVQSYSIGAKGDFSVSLEAPCYAKIEDQPAYYSKHITGKLKYGSISNLSGIQTKQLFVWLPVTGIYVDIPATPYIYFEVGVLTKRLSIAIFETPPRCSSHGVDTGIHVPNLYLTVKQAEFMTSRPRKAIQ
nr:uncharacterized protein LOC112277644 isoform X1 [Physcomitrium patens]|eukprot:XP_024365974.1 uncharacterized protein LOC112277644 isoform X1 [Physcomitrella patens]